MTNKLNALKHNKTKLLLPVFGLIALIWFLVRVIPKPSRASYPCQRAAFPIASAFVIWLTGIISSVFLFKRARRYFRRKNYLPAFSFLILCLILYWTTTIFTPFSSVQSKNQQTNNEFVPTDGPNQPIGKARGIFPGRVVWMYDPDATSWNPLETKWWSNESIDTVAVRNMLSKSVQLLTETTSDNEAWEAIFQHFNVIHEKGEVGYADGEKIAVKLNMNTVSGHNDGSNSCYNSPQMVEALLRQLVYQAGVPASAITFYDVSRAIPFTITTRCKEEFPDVNFMDLNGGDDCKKFEIDISTQIQWAEELTLENGGGNPTFLPKCVTQANYIINFSNLKGHDLAGVTICSKNHFGTICTESTKLSGPRAAGVHPYIAVHDFGNPGGGGTWDMYGRDMETYNALVDVIGHKDIGEKTLLYIVDALYTTQRQNNDVDENCKWEMQPFNNDWMSSMFISQDGLALESVGLDFLRCEPSQYQVYGNVDNYLHEAALADMPPSKTVYDPEGDGIPLLSLGVHEHWNDAVNKQYTRNLGTGEGIELISYRPDTIVTGHQNLKKNETDIRFSPNPAKNILKIKILHKPNLYFQAQIINSNGQTMQRFNKNDFADSNSLQIDISHYSQGIYWCILRAKNGNKSTAKFIKE